jgi:hypothetical protein
MCLWLSWLMCGVQTSRIAVVGATSHKLAEDKMLCEDLAQAHSVCMSPALLLSLGVAAAHYLMLLPLCPEEKRIKCLGRTLPACYLKHALLLQTEQPCHAAAAEVT